MTEKALLVKSCTSNDGRFYAVGLGGPHVRIFDTARGALCAHIDLAEKMAADKRAGLQSAINSSVTSTYHDRAQELAAIRDVTLTAVHIACPVGSGNAASGLQKGTAGDVTEASQICIAGFSNGTVMAVRLADDAILYHVAVSDTQQPAIAFASTGEYIFVLCANKQLHVIDCGTGTRRVLGIPVPANTSTLAVYQSPDAEAGRVDVLLCGTNTLLCSLHVPSHRSFQKMDSKIATLGGSSAPTTHAYLGSTLNGGAGPTNIGITCAASEGVVRVWDLSPSASQGAGAGAGTRCRRILPCNHRVASMSVRPERGVVSVTTFAGQVLIWEFVTADGKINTATGVAAIIARAGDAYAQPATVAIASTSVPSSNAVGYQRSQQLHRGVVRGVPTRKIIDACLVPSPLVAAEGTDAAASCNLVVVRGKYALPSFDGTSLAPVFGANLLGLDYAEQQQQAGGADPQHHLYLTAPGVTVPNGALGPNLSFNPHEGVVATATAHLSSTAMDEPQDEDEEAAAVAAFELKLGAGWATHTAEAHRALVTSTEEFSKPTIFHASSMKALPTGALTAKEADKALERAKKGALTSSTDDANTEGEAEVDDDEKKSNKKKGKLLKGDGALGLAVIPLYQALHANDRALVMELITLSSRSQADIIATVRKLELPYVLQLFNILSERLISLSQMDHPFHAWIAAILQARGVEMMGATHNMALAGHLIQFSSPKQFIAPLRHNYTSMLEMQDRLSVLYGRLSIFNAVKPREDANAKRNTNATMRKGTVGADPSIFPNCFKEVLQRPKGKQRKDTVAAAAATATSALSYGVVRVNSKVIADGGMKPRKSTVERRAERAAARKAERKRRLAIENGDADDDDAAVGGKKKKGGADDDVFDEADEDEMMDHLDDMNLDDSDDDEEGEEGEEEDEDEDVILDDGADDAADAEGKEDSDSSGDEADNLLDSEDELGLEEDEDEDSDGDDDEEGEDDDEDEDDSDDGLGDDDDDMSDDLAGMGLHDDNDADDADSVEDVENAIRHEFDRTNHGKRSATEKKRHKKMRTD